ncbi:MAG: two-component regulator propeller domain-containing protein, partial [Acidobacteriota bacterium]
MGSSSETANLVVRGDDCIRTIYLRSSARLVWVVLLWFLICPAIFALDRDRTIDQFYHTAWTAKEGVPGAIRAIAQTDDGYLWLGSTNGLYRFDGVQFDRYEPQSGGKLPSNEIFSLLVTPDDGLWIGYWFGGASFLKDGNLTNYGEANGLPVGRFPSFVKDEDGTVWIAASNGLARFEDSRWQRVGSEWNYPGKAAQSISLDKNGTLWVATEDTVVFLPKGSRSFQPTGEHVTQVLKIVQSPQGSMWMSETMRSVRQIKLSGIIGEPLGPEIRVGSKDILFDREGALWVTSLGDGIRRVPYTDRLSGQTFTKRSTNIDSFTEKEGLSSDFIFTVFEDREGNIWVGTANGLDRFRQSDFVPVRFPPGEQNFALAAGHGGKVWIDSRMVWEIKNGESVPVRIGWGSFSAIYRDDEDNLWVGGAVGIHRIRDNVYSETLNAPVPKSTQISSIFKDHQNVFWFYFGDEGLFNLTNGVWSRYERQSELPKATPIVGSIDSHDRKWFGYTKNSLTEIDAEKIRTFSRDDGLEVGDVKAIQEGGGHIWVGGTDGVAVYTGDRFYMITGKESEEFGGVSGIVMTRDGSLWLNESRGIVHIPEEEVSLFLNDPTQNVRFRLFDFLDGLQGTAQQNAPFPTAVEGTDGRLWFSTSKNVVWIDPKKISTNSIVPPVSIRSVIIDEKSFEPTPFLQLPKGTTRLQINFTALSLSIPERVRFRYRLEGVDEQWQESGTKREATYTNLGAGSYRFFVIACNNDGVWNDQGTTLDFEIQPAFYQTYLFRTLSIFVIMLLFGALIWLFYQRRMSQATARLNTRFEARLSERTRIAQDLHDTLLQGVVSAA